MDMRGQVGDAIEMINVLTNPDRFFAELSRRDASLKIPAIIVLVAAIVPIIPVMIYYPSDAAAAAAAIVMGSPKPFIWWFLYAGAFYVVSMLFGGVGSFKRVLEFTGYSYIPVIPLAILIAVVPYSLLSYSLIGIILSLLTLWRVSIWVFAVKHARNLSTWNALITVLGVWFVSGLLMLFLSVTDALWNALITLQVI